MVIKTNNLFQRIQEEIKNYQSQTVEISPGVHFSQYDLINRIYKFRNRDLKRGLKVNDDLSYDYYFDIISPRVDSEVKNLRFDTKNILLFSLSPQTDFAAVFIANASLKSWMAENGEDIKLKTAVEEFISNGNIGFKRIGGGYEIIDPLNTYITNTRAETVDDTDIIERHEMTSSQIRQMEGWDKDTVEEVIKNCGNKFFKANDLAVQQETTSNRYEIFEFTGEVSEAEYNEIVLGDRNGKDDVYFIAKIIVCGLKEKGKGEKYVLFSEKLNDDEKISDYYIYAHKGRYNGRFWRIGTYELLFDHQVRSNEIGNDIARGLEWSSKALFKSADSRPLENIRADLDNGDIIHNAESLTQLEVRMQGLDQLIADWNRIQQDADKLTNTYEVVRGENLPSGTPFRLALLMDQNAGKFFVMMRQKLCLPYKRVFREWILPELVKDMKSKKIFTFTGDNNIIEQLRELIVESWYADNLIEIGPHTKQVADAIKQEKLEELSRTDPTIENAENIWKDIYKRLFVTITGEEYLGNDQVQDIMSLIGYEQDINRVNYMLDMIYKIRGLNIPPKMAPEPMEMSQMNNQSSVPQNVAPGQEQMVQGLEAGGMQNG